jgi:Family of unknown function (DUF6515)
MEVITMSYSRNKSWYLVIGLMLLVFSGIMLFGFTQVASAEGRGSGHHEVMDSRHGHNHAYPARGQHFDRLPSGYRAVVYGHSRYYFHGGVWYRPYGRGFVVDAPPFGLIVPFLPLYYTSLWIGDIPYYYANETYYTQTAGGYMVVEPPKGEATQAPPTTAGQLFIYPRNGQSKELQAKDRYECHSWAVGQIHYDPTQPAVNVPEAQTNQKRADYNRAMGACLDGRGYTVK